MRQPEYWEPDEVHEQFFALEAQNAEILREAGRQVDAGHPRSALAKAISRARGEIHTKDDMRRAIDFQNKLYAALTKSRPLGE